MDEMDIYLGYNLNIMWYVYIIRSAVNKNYYVGFTHNVLERLQYHNGGNVVSTKPFIPYALAWYGAFEDKGKAQDFERYLKSSSGHAFRNKHLL